MKVCNVSPVFMAFRFRLWLKDEARNFVHQIRAFGQAVSKSSYLVDDVETRCRVAPTRHHKKTIKLATLRFLLISVSAIVTRRDLYRKLKATRRCTCNRETKNSSSRCPRKVSRTLPTISTDLSIPVTLQTQISIAASFSLLLFHISSQVASCFFASNRSHLYYQQQCRRVSSHYRATYLRASTD